jgi:hypothetical protein
VSVSSARLPGIQAGLVSFFRRPATIVFLVATALAVVVTYPVILHFGDDIYGFPGDATGGVTQYWWWGYAITHGGSIFDNTLEGVPLGSEWSQIPFVVLPLIIFTPLSVAIGPIAGYNLLILSSFPLTAWATFLLVRRLGFDALASAFAGLAFVFSPYHIEKAMGHGNQTHMELIVLTLYFLVRWRQTGRLRDAAFAGVMAGLQLWMDYSLSYVLVFALLSFFVVSALIPENGKWSPRWLWRHVPAGALMTLVAALFGPLTLLAAHRPGPGSLAGALGAVHRSIGELEIYSARINEYIEPWHDNPLVPAFVKSWEDARLHGSSWIENSLFLGYTVIVLALVGLVLYRRRFPTTLGVAIVLVGAILSEPPMAHVLGVRFNTPSYYLYDFITFFRVYARFAIVVMLGAAILAAAGFAALQARLGGGRRQLLLVLPFLLLAIEFNNIPPTHVTAILPAPAEYTWLAQQPQGILMEYPANSGSVPIRQEVEIRQYMLYQMVHLHPTFLNETALTGTVADAAAHLEPYYKPGVAAQLKAYGVRYVFVHRADYTAAGWDLPTAVDGLTYMMTLDGVDIYIVG